MKYFWPACLALFLAASAIAQNQFVYTNNNVSTGINQNPVNSVSAFKIDADGSLTQVKGSPYKTGGAGGGNSIDPEEIAIATQGNANFLYAANDGSGTISAYAINPVGGSLARVPGSPFLADGAPGGDYSLAASPNGQFLFATADTATDIHIYSVGSNGSLSEIAGSPFPTGANSEGLKVTPNGKFLVVGENSLKAVGVYSIGVSGALTAVAGSPFPASASPFDVEVNCAGNLVFVIDNGSFNGSYSVIDAYSMSSGGSLTPIAGEPFYNGTSSTNGGLALSPNGQFLFVTDTFSNDISSMSVASDGALSQVAGSPFATSSWTGGVSVSRSGKFVYSALFTVAQIDGRAVDSTGALTPVPGTPFSTGQAQTGVPTVITFPPRSCSAP
ncbi:MAG TPA: beta-propeller fold lactonase family protein [Candidatus Acidoferrum sp.]|jgi:6-phosphogluconolactonase|nr:beta-propeller fold lactonase family protein [Candidatus Acidoferrum sp.]